MIGIGTTQRGGEALGALSPRARFPSTSRAVTSDVTCRDCSEPVDSDAPVCPHCGASRPAVRGEGYEWKSRLLWMGFPVVHVAFGRGSDGRPRTARGVVAIGQRAVGGVAIGIVASGFFAIGFVAIGCFTAGVVSIAALGAVGVNAFAPAAIGITAFGYIAGGVAPFGWKILFSVAR